MAEKIVIDIYRKKPLDELTEILSRPDSKLETGSSSAAVATMAAALLVRGASLLSERGVTGERIDYIIRNSEKLRDYMYYLIDEDVKCRGPIKKALAEDDPVHIEACIQPATAICSEIIGMMLNLLNLAAELCSLGGENLPHYIFEASDYAMSSIRSSASYILSMISLSTDDTYIYVTKRENEITYKEAEKAYNTVRSYYSLPF